MADKEEKEADLPSEPACGQNVSSTPNLELTTETVEQIGLEQLAAMMGTMHPVLRDIACRFVLLNHSRMQQTVQSVSLQYEAQLRQLTEDFNRCREALQRTAIERIESYSRERLAKSKENEERRDKPPPQSEASESTQQDAVKNEDDASSDHWTVPVIKVEKIEDEPDAQNIAAECNNAVNKLNPSNCTNDSVTKSPILGSRKRKMPQVRLGYSSPVYNCSSCVFTFRTKAHLLKHVALVHSKPVFICSNCGIVLEDKGDLEKHMKASHLKTSCKKCKKVVANKIELKKHNCTRHTDSEIPFNYWDDTFSSALLYYRLQIASNINNDEANKQVENNSRQSKQSTASFVNDIAKLKNTLMLTGSLRKQYSKSKLQKQKKNGNPSEKRMFQCKDCPRSFKTYSGVFRHKNSVHLKTRIHCDLCDSTFKSRPGLIHHKNVAHLKRRLQCTQCDKEFTTKQAIEYHKNSVHLNTSFHCDQCGRNFPHKSTLGHHKKSKHPKKA